MLTLDDLHEALEPLRERIRALPEAEREAVAEHAAGEIAAGILLRVATEESVYRRILAPTPVDERTAKGIDDDPSPRTVPDQDGGRDAPA